MKIYNSLTNQKEEFVALEPTLAKMYSCGPTVYNHAHIGNLRTFLNTDFLRRWLEFSGYQVKQIINITDVDDKIINAAKEQKTDIENITNKFEKYFYGDLERLNVEKADNFPRATEEIESMIKIISSLLEKGYAYKSDDGSVYFSISKFKDYGKLAKIDFAGIKVGARIDQDEYDKESAQDFVLWKSKKEGEPSWDAPFGEGRPGWHIECSAMSMKYLGEQIDIHTGGVDLLFPHHENEIAQSEAYSEKKFVNYWFHGEFLSINGQKMSKSLKNIYTLDDIIEKYSIEPLSYRLLCLMSHYREKLNFTDQSIVQAQNTLNNLRRFVINVKETKLISENEPIDIFIMNSTQNLANALDDDLNTPKALAEIFEFIKRINLALETGITKENQIKILSFIENWDKIFGLNLLATKKVEVSAEAEQLIKERDKARAEKNWQKSDTLRKEIENLGYEVLDTSDGTVLR